MINAPQLLADLTRLLKRLEDDLRTAHGRSAGAEGRPAGRVAGRARRRAHCRDFRELGGPGHHTGWSALAAFLRVPAIHRGQPARRAAVAVLARTNPAGSPWRRTGTRPISAPIRWRATAITCSLRSARRVHCRACRRSSMKPTTRCFALGSAAMPQWRCASSGSSVDPNTGALVHDFTDPEWNTRFLGDLYQDLSEEATRSAMRCCRRPSSSRSSSSTARSRRLSASSASARCG